MCVDPVYPFSRKLARKQENPSAATDKSKPAAKVLSARKLCSGKLRRGYNSASKIIKINLEYLKAHTQFRRNYIKRFDFGFYIEILL